MGRKSNLESDSKYRTYSAAIDKCLKSFEYSNEWADLISSLVRLIKLIQQYDRYDVIPKKRLLGKRLAQCLHPALPPGVHCKTLECFDLIFRIMGPDNLATDIGIYGPCLFGLLGPSAMTVKPLLFNLFETYFLPLGDKLQTSFLGFLQGLLPGLEEGSEFFERGNGIIEKFCQVIGPEFFYSSLWQVLIQAPSVRHFGTAYILNHFNKRRHLSSQAYVFGTSTSILLESLRCLLKDDVVLVQRDTLDFLILTLPVHLVASSTSSTKQPATEVNYSQHPLEGRISPMEMRDLVAASLTVLLRKDASLNRRIFIWLLGSQNVEAMDAAQQATTVARMALPSSEMANENDSTVQQEYFKRFSLPLLTEALHSVLQSTLTSPSSFSVHSGNRSACFRPFRLMSGLLNRSEIGSVLVEKVLVDLIFFTLHMSQRLQQGGDGGAEKLLTTSSPTSSDSSRGQNHQNLPQQTLEMLAQFESYTENSGNKSSTSYTNKGEPNRHPKQGRRRPSRLSNTRRWHQRNASEVTLESVSSATFSSGKPSLESEFLREAELFFSNLESAFLWPFLQDKFFYANSSTKVRPGWVSAVRFLVEHLPVDTYPDVRGCHLPRLVSALSGAVCERMGQLSLAEIADFVDLLGVLIGHIQEHMVTMLDQSLAEASRMYKGTLRVYSTSAQKDAEIRLISGMVGDIRNLLGVFFKHFLTTASSNIVEECLEKLQRPEKNLHSLESEFTDLMNPRVSTKDRPAVVDLLAQLCRLVVDMCNVPIVQPSETTQEEFNFNQLFYSGPVGDDNCLPDWLTYLVAGSAFARDFDTKTICLHTVLDLVEASTSIHGWTAEGINGDDCNDNANSPPTQSQWGTSGLILPILAKDVLSTLASTLDFFPLTAVSLWSFLNDSTQAEDAASLILRVISVSPHNTFTSTETLVENFVVQQMLSTDSQIRLEAHRRFALLWKLLRRSTTTGNSVDRSPGGLNVDSLNSSGWRRAAMGLPPITNELSANVLNFNRCLLILLDNLEDTSTTNASNSAVDEFSNSYCGLNDSVITNNNDIGTGEERLQAEIRQTTTTWLISALSCGQAGPVVAPLFATLLHPSTARTSLLSIRNRRHRLRLAKRRRNRRRLRQLGEMQMSNHTNNCHAKETDGALFSGDESEDAEEVEGCYEEFDVELENEWNGYDDDGEVDDDWDEYDRNIFALSGGSPWRELHYYVSSGPSQASPKESVGKRKKRLGVFSKTPILRRKKKNGGAVEGAGGAIEGDVFDEEYRPVDVMTRLQPGGGGSAGNRNSDQLKDAERISLDRIRRDVIQGLLAELLKPHSDEGETLTSPNLSPFDQMISQPVKVLPVHEHLLVYLHKYDFNQVIYAFTRLRAILKSQAGSLFLLSLAVSPTMERRFASPSSLSKQKQEAPHFTSCEFPKLFGISLVHLLARHFRCLFAGGLDNFARQATTNELNGVLEQIMPSLLDVLLHVCIAFHVSLVLPDAQSPLDAFANSSVRLIAAEVLQLITDTMLQLSKTLSPIGVRKFHSESFKEDAEMATLISALQESNSLWIDSAIQRSGLSHAVLHSLATFTEISQWTENMSQLKEEAECLPLCMRLLLQNYSKEGSSTLSVLLQITNNLLQLTEPHLNSPTKSSVVSAPVNSGRGSRNSPTEADVVKKRISDTPSQQSTQAYHGILPWCVSTSSTLDAGMLETLASRKFSSPLLTLLASCYASGSSLVCRTRPRHVATQSLLLNTVRVALNPTAARVDLHPLWFGFVRRTLVHWGSATPLLINTVITQMAVTIQLLAEPFCQALVPVGLTDRVPPSAYPPDYSGLLFACLQGIVHTFLLPHGQSKATLLEGMTLGTAALAREGSPPAPFSAKSSPAHHRGGKVGTNNSANVSISSNSILYTSTNVDGLSGCMFDTPEALRDSLQVAEALEDFHSTNQFLDFPSVGQALQRMQLAFLEDPAIPSALAGSAALLFAAKDFIGTELMPASLSAVQNWARGRAEMCHVFPVLLSSLAGLWLALNQSCDPRSPHASTDEESEASCVEAGIDVLSGETPLSDAESSPMRLRCGFVRLAALTTLGCPDTVRRTIHALLEPIALTHPALVLSALAYVWPPLLSAAGQSGVLNMDIMWLLSSSSSSSGLPMTVRQCALISLISGAQLGCQAIGDRTGRYVGVASFSNIEDMEKPIPLLRSLHAVKTFKNLLRSPPASLSYAYAVDLPNNGDLLATSPSDTAVPAQIMQSSLLHFLYAWIVSSGGVGISYFHLANIQDFLRDVVPLTSVSAAISTTIPGAAITSPISVFVLVKIFNEVIVTLANKDEKRDQKDLQDICQRLMEATASIAGTALEQATWFRRGLQVRSSTAVPPPIMTSSALEVSTTSSSVLSSVGGALRPTDLRLHPTASESALSEVKLNGVNTPPGVLHDSLEVVSTTTAENREFKAEDLSVLALRMLAEHMAVFFDVVYKSEEKDRVPSALNNGILTNILPFLKSRNIGNAFHYNAASQVMASLSSYQFTRRAWRRDIFELFVDAAFFQATPAALHAWCTIVDNLMTQEKNIFKEVLTRLTVSQGAGLNIFSSKEAECEQRAANMKKISFIVFASEREQYCRSVSDILERLTDNLRAMTDLNVPILTQMFLCTRVLVARISSESLASLWLLVLPELVNVFRVFAEQCNGSSRKRSRLKYEDLQKLPQAQLNLLLSASKLLATILLLPESTVPQLLFQRWVFVNRGVRPNQGTMEESGELDDGGGSGIFQPLMSQIASGLASIYQSENQIYATRLLSMTKACYFILATKTITDFERLELFFRSLGEKRGSNVEAYNEILDEAELNTLNQVLEVSTFNEFPEPLAASK